ncbi:MAG: M48 family metallopeptidase [Bacteroidetes bacterium]|nr:M48 family metallopeptidase [Bacteroidota bacterium]
MKRISILIQFVFVSAHAVLAQLNFDFQNYQPLKCSGEMPQDFKIELEKYVQEAENNSSLSKKDKAQHVKYAEISNHNLNNLLYSGKVLYGDPLSQYINKVADIALSNDKPLRQQLRFYVLKSAVPNAFATQRGVIFITIGLLAQLESEAQLAFVICHEAIHVKNNHNIETYKRRQNIKLRNNNA